MSLKTQEIAKAFGEWLDRYSPPRNMADKPDVQASETQALLRMILKFAPKDGYNGWLVRVLDKLEFQMKTRAWPTVGEVGSVCSNLRKEEGASGLRDATISGQRTPHDIVADRINRNEAVGDEWLYGKRAVELVDGGYASEGELDRYRSGLFFSMRDAWGAEKAASVEADLKRKHEEAKTLHRQKSRTDRGPMGMPDKRHAPEADAFA